MFILIALVEASALIIVLLLSLSVHEFAHAWVANLFGDPTARVEGRMSLNPLKHWDPLGTTLLVVLILLNSFGLPVPVIGWGKPVPVDERNFENPVWHGFQTAIAGPMSNLLFATILALVFRLFEPTGVIGDILTLAVYINAFLMFFNLLPIPPLDGSRILRLFLPEETYWSLASNPILFYVLFLVVVFFLATPLQHYSAQLSQFLLNGA